MSQKSNSITLIIATYNRPRALDLVLEALSIQSVMPDQIIIADDGSGEKTREVTRKWINHGLPIIEVWQPDAGFRKARILNRAILEATGDWCIFLDGDCIPLRNFIRDHSRNFESGYALAGPRIMASQKFSAGIEHRNEFREEVIACDFRFLLQRRLLGDINRLSPVLSFPNGAWRKITPRKWSLLRGCNFSVERVQLFRIDGFDESISGWGFEDSDLAVRLINAEIKIKNLRLSAPVLHLWHPEQSRDRTDSNMKHLNQSLEETRVKSVKGLSKLSARRREEYNAL